MKLKNPKSSYNKLKNFKTFNNMANHPTFRNKKKSNTHTLKNSFRKKTGGAPPIDELVKQLDASRDETARRIGSLSSLPDSSLQDELEEERAAAEEAAKQSQYEYMLNSGDYSMPDHLGTNSVPPVISPVGTGAVPTSPSTDGAAQTDDGSFKAPLTATHSGDTPTPPTVPVPPTATATSSTSTDGSPPPAAATSSASTTTDDPLLPAPTPVPPPAAATSSVSTTTDGSPSGPYSCTASSCCDIFCLNNN